MRSSPLGIFLMSSFVRRHTVMAFVPRRLLLLNRRQGIHHLAPSTTEELSSAPSSSTATIRTNNKITEKSVWVLQFDGGSRGNPGRAGSGSVIYKSDLVSNDGNNGEKCILSDSEEIWTGYHYLGEHVTNNVAEYSGLIEGLKQAVTMKITSLLIQGDSQLILNQVDGSYKVKNANLKQLHLEARNLLLNIPKHILEYIPRAQNARADQLSNEAMDTMGVSSVMSTVHSIEEVTTIQVAPVPVPAVKEREEELFLSTTNSSSNVSIAPLGLEGEGVSDVAEVEDKETKSSSFTLQVDYSNVIVNYEEQTMTLSVPFSDLKFTETKHTASGLFPTMSLLVDTAKMTAIENVVKAKRPRITKEKSIMGEIKLAEKDKKKLEKLMGSSVPSKVKKSKDAVEVTAGGEGGVEGVKGKKGGGSKRIGMSA